MRSLSVAIRTYKLALGQLFIDALYSISLIEMARIMCLVISIEMIKVHDVIRIEKPTVSAGLRFLDITDILLDLLAIPSTILSAGH